jgi:hypothetical protein
VLILSVLGVYAVGVDEDRHQDVQIQNKDIGRGLTRHLTVPTRMEERRLYYYQSKECVQLMQLMLTWTDSKMFRYKIK